MKYLLLIGIVALFTQTSCEKCTTCTYTDVNTSEVKTEEICNKGKVFENQREKFELNGWVCN